jgi:hypothetical protein
MGGAHLKGGPDFAWLAFKKGKAHRGVPSIDSIHAGIFSNHSPI